MNKVDKIVNAHPQTNPQKDANPKATPSCLTKTLEEMQALAKAWDAASSYAREQFLRLIGKE